MTIPLPDLVKRPSAVPLGSPASNLRWLELLAQRERALAREWRQVRGAPAPRDDDLLPDEQRVEQGLVEVGLALERIDRGSYGQCQCCGGRIDFERLLVLPTAARCWPCQQAAEEAAAARRH